MTTPTRAESRTEFEAAAYRWLRDRPHGPLSGSEFMTGICIDEWNDEGAGYQLTDFAADTAIAAAMGWPTVLEKGG